ncbi:MAG: hypothetical protein DRO87_09930 [Candidatus Thorarchaeota archaeon]|nr:MAG: hypothetical protein DRO87_09930 [Candidatus Thorarchaeota archaeon]RLI57191.1 MAG: hypothetical protein DRP09_04100 [Candidatus Thorarchaeota archaeon]
MTREVVGVSTVFSKDIQSAFPISWMLQSRELLDYLTDRLGQKQDVFAIADFASGEYDRVPSFFLEVLSRVLDENASMPNMLVYCIDLHPLRLESLAGKLEQNDLLDRVRLVEARLETMDSEARFAIPTQERLRTRDVSLTWIDQVIETEKRIPRESFSLGLLNNDIIGYLLEYYKKSSDLSASLEQVHRTLRKNAFLVVTAPCSVVRVDNVEILEEVGFQFVEGVDVTFGTGDCTKFHEAPDVEDLSMTAHYSLLVFVR